MKKLSGVILCGMFLFLFNNSHAASTFNAKTTLSGIVTDKATGEPLSGASIYITDLKTGAVSDVDGKYKIENLPQSKVLIEVSYIGYETVVEQVDLAATTTKDFALKESIAEIHEIVVTGLSHGAEKNRTPTPISTISKAQLLTKASTNIIDALATQPGISQVTTGSGISKPVIRGLGYNRVVVVNDGIRQEGQQWGDEHGIEIDEYGVNHVEVLKGPASLSYGSDAMAGVINFLTAPTLPDGKIQGNLLANYQTNNGLIGFSGNVTGNQNGLIWDLRYSDKQAHAYQNKYDGYVQNSGFKENTLTGIIGLNKPWGYSHLHFSMYNLTPGIVEGERDSATGQFVKPIVENGEESSIIATDKDFKSYDPEIPYQKIHHYKAVLNNSFIIGNSTLKATLGFQQNQRQEYADILEPNDYGLYFLLNTLNYDVRYLFPQKNGFDVSVGGNGMYQTSQNKGIEFLVPAYHLFDFGVFAIAKKTIGKLDISGGLRYDTRSQKGDALYLDANGEKVNQPVEDGTQQFKAFNSTFSGISGSVGAAYQISDQLYTKLNFSRGFRAPNIAELGANGVHEGTIRYEIGNPNLKAENSLQVDYALGFNSPHVTAEVDVFNNHINNFIFLRKLDTPDGRDSLIDGFFSYKYVSGNANLFGSEVTLDIHPHPLDWLHFENSFSFVQAVQLNQPDSTKYLPFTPATRFRSELRANAQKLSNFLKNAYVSIDVEHYFTQDHFYAAFGTETKTPGYTLIDFGLGTDLINNGKTLCSLYFSINNLADVAYQSHLSRLKYGDENNVTGRTGVYNMGRNVSFKLLVPIDFK